VTDENSDNEIYEMFLGFTSKDSSSGNGLADVTLKFLEKNKLELEHGRGEGYGSAANIKGKNSGVKNRILDQNPLALLCRAGATVCIWSYVMWRNLSSNPSLCLVS
jgi:hypothetical protein